MIIKKKKKKNIKNSEISLKQSLKNSYLCPLLSFDAAWVRVFSNRLDLIEASVGKKAIDELISFDNVTLFISTKVGNCISVGI